MTFVCTACSWRRCRSYWDTYPRPSPSGCSLRGLLTTRTPVAGSPASGPRPCTSFQPRPCTSFQPKEFPSNRRSEGFDDDEHRLLLFAMLAVGAPYSFFIYKACGPQPCSIPLRRRGIYVPRGLLAIHVTREGCASRGRRQHEPQRGTPPTTRVRLTALQRASCPGLNPRRRRLALVVALTRSPWPPGRRARLEVRQPQERALVDVATFVQHGQEAGILSYHQGRRTRCAARPSPA